MTYEYSEYMNDVLHILLRLKILTFYQWNIEVTKNDPGHLSSWSLHIDVADKHYTSMRTK